MEIAEIFSYLIRRNPLKSPDLAKEIQAIFSWINLVLLGFVWR
jgi:hypothetical protein